MSLADYLAKNYLTADPAPAKKSKKRKRKEGLLAPEESGLTIASDDVWGKPTLTTTVSDDEDTPRITGTSSEFKKKAKSAWQRVGVRAPKDAEQAAADAIIADAARENRERAAGEDDGPVIEGDDGGDVTMAMEGYTDSGTRAGLQTSAQVAAAAEKMKREERRRMKEAMEEAGVGGGDGTIYRDASGRIINVAMKRAEARRKEEEVAAAKKEEAEAAKGDAQRVAKAERQQKLQDAKFMNFARRADDTELNEEMKEQDRWNDPAAAFVVSKKKTKTKSGKPLYQGSFMPNRFGIRPGYRWDGVDRGIGFEKRWFAARNKQRDRKELEYAWQMDE